jgi:hypothetical protein
MFEKRTQVVDPQIKILKECGVASRETPPYTLHLLKYNTKSIWK